MSKPDVKYAKFHDEISSKIQRGLCGLFFHVVKANKEGTRAIKYQGYVACNVAETTYLVTLYDWIMGEENGSFLVDLREMMDWVFYHTAEDMKFSYEHRNVASMERPVGDFCADYKFEGIKPVGESKYSTTSFPDLLAEEDMF
jgi:hypothetical protein